MPYSAATMRLGIIAAAAASGTAEPALGERDAQLLCERLALEDLGFVVHVIDPFNDMAEQLEVLLADYEGQLDDVFLYVSALTVTLEDGQCFLCLDVDNPDVGDGVRDLAAVLARRTESASLIFIEGRNDARDTEALRVAARALRDAIDPVSTGIETIVSMRNVGAHLERIPSRFTVGLLEELDSRQGSLQAKQAYAAVVQHADLGSWPHAELYASGKGSMALRDPAFLALPSSRPTASERPAPASADAGGPYDPGDDRDFSEDAHAAPSPPPPPAAVVEAPRVSGKGKGKKGEPRRAAQPSERADSVTATIPDKRRVAPQVDAELPKVVISPKADPRRRPTMRKFDADLGDIVDRGAGTSDNGQDGAARRSMDDDSEPPPPSSPPLPQVAAKVEPPPVPVRPRRAPVVVEEAPSERLAPEPVSAPEEPLGDAHREEEEEVRGASPAPSSAASSRPMPARMGKKPTEWTVQDHMEAGDELYAADDLDGGHAEFKKALGKLGTATTPARAELYVRIGNVNRRQGNGRLALSNYEKALGIVPQLESAHAGVLDLLVAQGNWRAVQNTEDKLLASLQSGDDRRLARLLEFGDRAADNGSDDQARTRFAQARAEFPNDERPLRRLLALFEKLHAVAELIEVRRRIAEFIDDPQARAQTYFELAQFCIDEGDYEEEALQLFELALDDDSELLAALESLAAILAENQEWAELERIYRKAIAAYADRNDATGRVVIAELHRKLALLFRDHLEDPEQAMVALSDELKLRPDDLSALLLAAELSVELEDPAKALVHLRRSTELEPLRIETYRQLYELGQRFEEPETSFLASSVMHALGAARDVETETFEAHRIQGVPAHRRPLRREAWSWLRDKKHDTLLDRVMRAIAPAVLRARVLQLEERGKLAPLPERQDPKTSTASVVRSIGWASQYLGVDAPAVYLDDKIDAPLTARFAKHQAMVVGKAAMRGRSVGELAFLAGRHLALRLPDHELVAHMQTIDELSACFLAGIKLTLGAAPSGPLAGVVDGLAKVLGAQISPDEFAELETSVKILTARTSQLDLGAWVSSVERCATRAGFVLCGDLALAIKQVESEGDSAFSTARARIADLCAFAVSGSHMKLRQELGSTLIDATERPRLTMPPSSH